MLGWLSEILLNYFGELLGVFNVENTGLFIYIAEDELEEYDSCRPYINFGIVELIAHKQFRGSERSSSNVADALSRLVIWIANKSLGAAQVTDFDLVDWKSVVVDQNVAELDISVGETNRVEIFESSEHSAHHLPNRLQTEVIGRIPVQRKSRDGHVCVGIDTKVVDCVRKEVGDYVQVLLHVMVALHWEFFGRFLGLQFALSSEALTLIGSSTFLK